MSTSPPPPPTSSEDYILLKSTDGAGKLRSVSDAEAIFEVCLARPRAGSLTERDEAETERFTSENVEDAAKRFFEKMRQTGLSGVLDLPELRGFQKTPMDFCCLLTETIADDIGDLDDEDARDDDFDNHPLSPLREAMVDACPEFSGETPSP